MSDFDSYPPALRHLNHHDDDDRQDPEPNESVDPNHLDSDPVPVIDLQCLNQEMEKLEEACREWGIFRLVNHGIPLTLLTQLEHLAKQLFSSPFESKQASCEGSPISYFWGTPALTPSGTALSGGPQKINSVEGFNVPLAQLSQFHPQLPLLESFRDVVVEYGKHLSRIGTRLFEGMAKNLEVNREKSRWYLSERTGNVRVYRYPNSLNRAGWGMEAHTDSSVLSILNQLDHQVLGLEVLKHHQWLPVKPIPNTLIVNLGDMMQAISDERYKSATHRVKTNKHKDRMSVCYFVFPEEQVVIESSKYKPFTYSDFRAQVQQDIKALGYKVGLPRFLRTAAPS